MQLTFGKNNSPCSEWMLFLSWKYLGRKRLRLAKKCLHPIELWSHYEVRTQSTKLTKHVPRTFANSQWKYLESGNQNTNGWMLIKLDITPVKPPFRQELPMGTAQVSKSNSSEFVRGLRAWTVCECWSFSCLNEKYECPFCSTSKAPRPKWQIRCPFCSTSKAPREILSLSTTAAKNEILGGGLNQVS
jgi:hypothetical protein